MERKPFYDAIYGPKADQPSVTLFQVDGKWIARATEKLPPRVDVEIHALIERLNQVPSV